MKDNYLLYEWPYKGMTSLTEVDPDSAQKEGQLLVICATLRQGFALERLSPSSQRKLEAYGDKLAAFAQKKGAYYAASRQWGAQIQLYFLCPRGLAAEEILKKAHKRDLEVSGGLQPDRSALEQVLPNRAQLQTISNEEMIGKMKRSGDEISQPRRINHYCAFQDEVSCLGFQQDALQRGFAIGDTFFEPERELAHGVSVRNIAPMDKNALDSATTKLVELAQKHDGDYLFWDCQIIRRSRL